MHDDIVLWHKIYEKGLEVDRPKIDVIKELPPPISVKGIKNFGSCLILLEINQSLF